jgi:hypothetical protein
VPVNGKHKMLLKILIGRTYMKVLLGQRRIVYLSYYLLLLMTFVSCSGGSGGGSSNGTQASTISSFAQKGPLASGSTITIQELKDNLVPTGNTYYTATEDDLGSFNLDSEISYVNYANY